LRHLPTTRTCRLKIDRSSLSGQSGPEHYVDFRMHGNSGSDPDVQHGSEGWIRTKWNSAQKYRDGLLVGTNPTDELITSKLREHYLMGATTRRCPGGEQLRRYCFVTVCRDVCLTRVEATHERE
jgi:hypothetical protein